MQEPLEVRLEARRNAPESTKAAEGESARPQSGLATLLNDSPRQVQLRAQAERLNAGRAGRPLPAPIQARASASLPAPLQAGMERLSGLSLDGVRVHYDSPEPERLGALAFAQGTDVHLGPGQEQHLPHEAWHVVQQAQGRVRPTLQAKSGIAINDETALELEADAMGARSLLEPIAAPTRLAELRPPGQRLLQGRFAVQVVIEEFMSDDLALAGGGDGGEGIDVEAEGGDGGESLEAEAQEADQGVSDAGPGILANAPAADLRIAAVHIAGRPPGLFTNAEKSHSTAWALYTDLVRSAVLGRDVTAAAAAVADLTADAKLLPGVARAPALGDAAKTRYDEAEKALDDLAALDVGSIPAGQQVGHVQRLIRAFLTYRNLIPLSQVDLGRAPGHGEPKELKTLRRADDSTGVDWIEDPEDAESAIMKPEVPQVVRTAMWKLLDEGVIRHFIQAEPLSATVPGMKPEDTADPSALIADVVTQHLWTLEGAYQTSYSEADMENSYDAYLDGLGLPVDVKAAVVAKIEAHYAGGEDSATTVNPDRLRTQGLAKQAIFAVQVETSDEGNVSKLHVGGRAKTPMGSDQGSHSTAWLVYVDAVRLAVVGKSLAGATGSMLGLCAQIDSLPGMARVGNLTPVQKSWFDVAQSAFEEAKTEASVPADPLEGSSRLQQLIRAYLSFRNAVPLSQIKGGLADANSEGRNRAIMLYRESDFTKWSLEDAKPSEDPKVYLTAFWELYDYEKVGQAARHDMEPEDAPGIDPDEDPLRIAGDSIRQHLIAMRSAYPNSFAGLDPESDASLGYLFDLMDFAPDNAALLGRVRGQAAQASTASSIAASSMAASSMAASSMAASSMAGSSSSLTSPAYASGNYGPGPGGGLRLGRERERDRDLDRERGGDREDGPDLYRGGYRGYGNDAYGSRYPEGGRGQRSGRGGPREDSPSRSRSRSRSRERDRERERESARDQREKRERSDSRDARGDDRGRARARGGSASDTSERKESGGGMGSGDDGS